MKSLFIFICFSILLIACIEKKEVPPKNEIEEVSSTSARENLDTAQNILSPVDSSALLFLVSTSNLDSFGKSFGWNYQYRSLEKEMIYKIELDAFSVYLDSTNQIITGVSNLSKSWIDSDVAFIEAEKNGGLQFKKQHANCKVEATLSEPVIPDAFPIWHFIYTGGNEQHFINVNAVTGKILNK